MDNTKEIIQLEKELLKESDVHEDDFRVFSYFKEHPATAITCVSALVAVLAFVSNMGIFLFDSAFLNYWKVDISYVNLNKPNQLYHICGTIIEVTCAMCSVLLISRAYAAHIPAKRWMIYFSAVLKTMRKQVKIIAVSGNEDNSLEERKGLLKTLECDHSFVKKSLRRRLGAHIILANIIMLFGIIMYSILKATLTWKMVLEAALVTVLMTMLSYGMFAFAYRKKINRKDILKKAEELSGDFAKDVIASSSKYPLFKEWVNALSDTSLKLIGEHVVLQMIVFLLILYLTGYTTAMEKKEFQVVYEDNQTYVVVYNTGTSAILEECVITEQTMTVNKNKQKIVSTNGLEYEIVEFEDIK